MNDQSNNQDLSGAFIGLGVLLVVLGALFFVGQAVGFFPTSTGLGHMLYGSLKGRKEMVVAGGRSGLVGAALFVVGHFSSSWSSASAGWGLVDR